MASTTKTLGAPIWLLVPATLALVALIATPLLESPSGVEPAHAGTAVRMEVSELVDGSGLVLSGRVLEKRCVEAAGGRIDTLYTLEVERTFWGSEDAGGERTLRLPGGILPDGRGMVLPGVPSPRVGEEGLWTLSVEDQQGLRMPVGLAQGWFRLLDGPDGTRLAVRPAGGAGLTSPGAGVGGSGAFVMDYGELVAEVVRSVEARRARGEEPPR